MQKLIECIPNFSEGRRQEVVDQVAAAVRGVQGVRLLDVSSNPDHNRTVLTFVGEPDAVAARPPLIAFNVNLGTTDLNVAKNIAKGLRESSGGLMNVQAMGVDLAAQ